MKGKGLIVLCVGITVLMSHAACEAQSLPCKAFPDAVGWAACTPGGRGGRIIRVTNLNADGPGSFAEAVRAGGPRIVVFDVAGVIDLAGRSIGIDEPFVTIAGQTAPSPGITLVRGGIGIHTHDVVLQHVRVRPGEAGHAKKSGWEIDAIATSGPDAYDVIVDHCSCSWATDENLSASGPRFDGDDVEQWRCGTSRKITFSNCIIAEGLSQSAHGKGEHSKGTLIHDNCTDIAIVGNLYAHNRDRNPLFKGGARGAVVNNYIYNPGGRAVHYALVPSEWGERPYAAGQMVVVGNVLESGPSTRRPMSLLRHHRGGPCEVYLADNLAIGQADDVPLLEIDSRATLGECRVLGARPFWPPELVAVPAAEVKDRVLANAGARPWDRDEVDRRIVSEVRNGQGRIIDSEQEVGGYPRVKPTRSVFDPSRWNLHDMTEREPQRSGRLRVVIETDAPGGDPDDEGSLVRLFLYLNEWDVEGLIGTRGPGQSRLGISGKDRILQYVDDYERIYANLKVHKAGYPEPNELRRITKQCYTGQEGRDHVIAVIDRDDPRPIWYLNWGTNEEDDKPTALREALDHVKQTRSDAAYHHFAKKLHYVEAHNQNHLGRHRPALGFYMDTFYPNMDGGRWYHRWRPLTERAGGFEVDRDIKTGHGPLCAGYTIQKEGDTPAFMHLIPNGLNVPERPAWGGWSGRYGLNPDLNMWWCDRQDAWQGTVHRDNTLKKWAAHIQNDFRARADWCVARTYGEANHEPLPCVQGDATGDVVFLEAPVGTAVSLSAEDSTDPDGDRLAYRWMYYPEAGTFGGDILIDADSDPACSIAVPAEALGKTIHVVLVVTDSGDPPLTRYRRIVITGTSGSVTSP